MADVPKINMRKTLFVVDIPRSQVLSRSYSVTVDLELNITLRGNRPYIIFLAPYCLKIFQIPILVTDTD